MTEDEDASKWLESHVNPFVPSPHVHPTYEDAAQAAHAARMQHLRRRQQQQQQVQREQWKDPQREQYRQQQHQQHQQQLQQYQQGHSQLQALPAFEVNTPRGYDGAQMVSRYNHGQRVTTGAPGDHSVRPSNRVVPSTQYMRPSDIGPSIPYYPPNTSRRANVPFLASSRPSAGAMQASRPVMSHQRTSQSVSEYRFPGPSDYTAQRSSTPTSHHAGQGRSSVPMPNGLPTVRQQYGGHQNQARASARPANQSGPASTATNLKADTYTSAAKSSLGSQSTNQIDAPKPVFPHPPQKPAVMGPASAPAVSGLVAQNPSDSTVRNAQMDVSVFSGLAHNSLHRPASRSPQEPGISMPYSQTTSMPVPQSPHQSPVIPGQNNPGNSHSGSGLDQSRPPYTAQAPVAHIPKAIPSSASQGQQPPNKMRRLEDGSKDFTSANTKEYIPRTKQTSKNKLKHLDLVEPLGVSDMFLKDSYDVATIARDVLIAAGKHPTEEVLNYHLHPLMKTIPVVDYSSDLASLRWDRIDPLIYARDTLPRNPPTRPPTQPINAIGAVALPSFHGNSVLPQPSLLPSLPHNSYPAKANPSIPRPPPISSTPIPAPERAPSKPQAAAETPTTKPSSTPRSKIPSTSPRAIPLAQSPQTKEAFQPQVVIKSSPQKMPPTKKRVGRPRKDAKRDNVAVTVLSPSQPPTQYPVFKCRWEKCQTELHTLVVLQQHVLKAHIPHNITCGWMACDNSTPMAASAMWEHMSETHIKDYAWALGDGPAVPSPGKDDQDESPVVPQFNLFDRQARVATVLLPLDPQVVKTYSKSHRINTPEQRAELFKNAGYRWKEEAGPDVDISDRRLSTPPRLVTSRLTEIAMTLPESP